MTRKRNDVLCQASSLVLIYLSIRMTKVNYPSLKTVASHECIAASTTSEPVYRGKSFGRFREAIQERFPVHGGVRQQEIVVTMLGFQQKHDHDIDRRVQVTIHPIPTIAVNNPFGKPTFHLPTATATDLRRQALVYFQCQTKV